MKFKETELIFDFPEGFDAYVADKPIYNGLSAVEFIVETKDKYLFIEVKYPDNPKARPEAIRQFVSDMSSDKFHVKIVAKLKDSLLKELAKGNRFLKPIEYILFLEYKEFNTAQQRIIFERVNSCLPRFIEEEYISVKRISFAIYNMSQFKKAYAAINVTPVE